MSGVCRAASRCPGRQRGREVEETCVHRQLIANESSNTINDALVHVHPDLAKLERRVTDERKSGHRRDGRIDLVLPREVVPERKAGSPPGVDAVQRRSSSESDEDFPGGEDVVALDFDRRCRESLCVQRSVSGVPIEERRNKPLAF